MENTPLDATPRQTSKFPIISKEIIQDASKYGVAAILLLPLKCGNHGNYSTNSNKIDRHDEFCAF